MPRWIPLLAAALVTAVIAPGASAAKFTISKSGNRPAVALDANGTAHVVWDAIAPGGQTSITHYCRVPRKAKQCQAGSERTFTPVTGDQDFAGPHVFLDASGGVVLVTTRCCTPVLGPDDTEYDTRVFRYTSPDGGSNWDAGAWNGTQDPGIDAALTGGGVLLTLGNPEDGDGTTLQAMSSGGFTGAATPFTPLSAASGGIGWSATTTMLAYNAGKLVYRGDVTGDLAAPTVTVKAVAKGSDVRTDRGPKGPDLFYKTSGKKQRYVIRRVRTDGSLGRAVAVSGTAFSIFGDIAQDPLGRVHAVWASVDGLTYRRSNPSATSFSKATVLAAKGTFYNLVVAANAAGRAVVVYDSNGDAGKVGGYTVG